MNTKTNAYSNAIADQNDTAKRAARNKRLLAQMKPELTPLLRRLEDFKPDGIYLSCYSYGDNDNGSARGELSVHVDVRALTGFKDERFSGLLQSLIEAGYDDCKTQDLPDSYSRYYTFKKPREARENPSSFVQIEILAQVKTDSETCQRVAIGTETRDVVKYKLVCEGEAA